jgi:putative transposase
MAATSMDVVTWLRNQLQETNADLLREMVGTFAESLISAEADALCGAPYGERSSDRVNSRNGYRTREWDTRAGTIELEIPKLRQGSYFPDWLLQPRRRAERAMTAVIAEAYLAGVSTRRVEALVQALGIQGISKSQVSELAKSLDEMVEAFRGRPLDEGPYAYLWLDALTQRCREGGRVVNVATVVATGVNADGHREILGVDVFTSEDGAAWTSFLRGLVARGLNGVQLVVSDAHPGLKAAIAAVLPGAAWQRCRVHRWRNVAGKLPKNDAQLHERVEAAFWTALDEATSATEGEARLRQLVSELERSYPSAAACLAEDLPALCVHLAYPLRLRRRLRSTNLLERSLEEVKRRTKVIGRFPGETSCLSLCWAVLDLFIASARWLALTALEHRQLAQMRAARMSQTPEKLTA